jgi:hypothetical protein
VLTEEAAMAMVEITCPDCASRVGVPAAGLLLEVASVDADDTSGAVAAWICLDCTSLVQRAVGWDDLARLAAAGAHLLDDAEPEPAPSHPESPPAGPVLRYDDVLDLHLLLAGLGWFSELERRTGTSDHC